MYFWSLVFPASPLQALHTLATLGAVEPQTLHWNEDIKSFSLLQGDAQGLEQTERKIGATMQITNASLKIEIKTVCRQMCDIEIKYTDDPN